MITRTDPASLAAWLGLEAGRSVAAMIGIGWSEAMRRDLADNAYATAVAAAHYGLLALEDDWLVEEEATGEGSRREDVMSDREREAQASMVGDLRWQPIETPPKTGAVIVWNDEGAVFTASWDERGVITPPTDPSCVIHGDGVLREPANEPAPPTDPRGSDND